MWRFPYFTRARGLSYEKNTYVFFLFLNRPSDKSAYFKAIFYFSSKTYFVGTQKNRLN